MQYGSVQYATVEYSAAIQLPVASGVEAFPPRSQPSNHYRPDIVST